MEIFTKTLFIELVPQAITILITIVVSWRVYPFAAVLLISLIPIALSVDYFFREAALASSKSTQIDGKLAGAIGSTVECRPAIRACNSGSWIEQQLNPNFRDTELAHRKNFFRAGLIQNAFETYTASYVLLIFISLGLGVFSGELSVGKFFAFMPIVMIMTGAIVFVGMASSQVAQYSGPLQTIRDLTNNNLDEEPPASRKSAQDTTALVPLANSLKVDDVTFAYRFDTPDVLKKINIDIAKGSYVVLCGGSG